MSRRIRTIELARRLLLMVGLASVALVRMAAADDSTASDPFLSKSLTSRSAFARRKKSRAGNTCNSWTLDSSYWMRRRTRLLLTTILSRALRFLRCGPADARRALWQLGAPRADGKLRGAVATFSHCYAVASPRWRGRLGRAQLAARLFKAIDGAGGVGGRCARGRRVPARAARVSTIPRSIAHSG